MDIQHSTEGKKGTFYIAEHGENIAEMVYTVEDERTILIIHTGVIEAFEGNGIGESLVTEAVNFARKSAIKIKAKCSFARSILEKNAMYKDVYLA